MGDKIKTAISVMLIIGIAVGWGFIFDYSREVALIVILVPLGGIFLVISRQAKENAYEHLNITPYQRELLSNYTIFTSISWACFGAVAMWLFVRYG